MPAKTREEWLRALTTKLTKKLFKPTGMEVPELQVSCGWPSTRALSEKKRAIGQCWPPSSAADGVPQLFISPWLDDPVQVGETLVHEMLHAVLPEDVAAHGKEFRAGMKELGLVGKPTETTADVLLQQELERMANQLGPYPHAKLDKTAAYKKQTTRLRKVECPACGYTARITKKWVDVGLPTCPCETRMEDVTEEGDDDGS